LHHPDKKNIFVSYGKILDLNNKEIIHNCNINESSSGSPILLLNNHKLIGMHCSKSNHHKYNKGTLLIYSIIEFSKIKHNLLIIQKQHIIAELYVKEDNQNIRIINSNEQSARDNKYIEYKKENENEKDIIYNCEIYINDFLMPFSYFLKFYKKGKYIIKYIFKRNMTKTNYMFSECSSLTNINLSNFNTDNVTNMSYMFNGCSSLTNINLSNFNTNNVTNMKCMFKGCLSLKNINLSIFNTNNVTNMSYMFSGCSSLTKIYLSNFNTNNIKDMSKIFYWCSSLTNINLSNFNTNNVNDMSSMFFGCSSLTNIDLSNFNTNNVKDMSSMFSGCSSLTNINLANFNTNNVKNMSYMFSGCKILTNNNVITNDKRILNLFN